MLEHKNGETIGQRYNRLVEHARKLDPRFVGGVASVPELARVLECLDPAVSHISWTTPHPNVR